MKDWVKEFRKKYRLYEEVKKNGNIKIRSEKWNHEPSEEELRVQDKLWEKWVKTLEEGLNSAND